MKNKIIGLLIVFVLMISLVGCKDKNDDDKKGDDQPTVTALEKINKVIAELELPTEVESNIILPTKIDEVSIEWESSKSSVLSNQGKVRQSENNQDVRLKGYFRYEDEQVVKTYNITVLKIADEILLQRVYDSLELESSTDTDLILETFFEYGVLGTWYSSNESIITTSGKFTAGSDDAVVTLTVILTLGEKSMEKSFEIETKGIGEVEEGKLGHLILDYAESFNPNNFNNVMLEEGKLVLTEGQTSGTYESDVIETLKWTSLVGSWAAISSTTATVEFQVRCRVNGTWSSYVTYGVWGLGLQNACHDQNAGVAKLDTDEFKVLNSKTADAVQYKLTLKRTNTSSDSPKVSLVACALEIPGYGYPVDVTDVRQDVNYDVPKLYQGAVPTIGNSICSATSTCMLLKYKGENFSQFDAEYEHRYMAGIVRDYGNNIYGNWVYNTVTMGGYGYNAYVMRMYSLEELVRHLNDVGPVSLSMKGQMTSDKKDYYTNGHLIVVTGYFYKDGNLYFYSNDPNVPAVACVYTANVIKNTWRNIAYIIE